MTEQEKMELIAESVDMEVEDLSPDMLLEDLEDWDSVAVLSIIATFNEKFNKQVNAATIMAFKTIRDLLDAMK